MRNNDTPLKIMPAIFMLFGTDYATKVENHASSAAVGGLYGALEKDLLLFEKTFILLLKVVVNVLEDEVDVVEELLLLLFHENAAARKFFEVVVVVDVEI